MQVGPYRVIAELARGGMGVVYRAQSPRGEPVALKLLLAHRAADTRARRRFEVELATLGRLEHPHVVRVLDTGEHEGAPWLALEFVDGVSLETRLQGGPLPIWEALRLVLQLSQALSYVHGCGVLHRDLKPGNVMLRGGDALLTDFGIARDDQSSLSRITATGVFQGTPGYWAPEQARGAKHEIGPHTDLYGLGAVLYACLTGAPPVRAGSLQEFLHAAEQGLPVSPPRRLRSEVPAWLNELCMRCLAQEATERPESADAVARALLLAEGGGGPRSRAPIAAAAVAALLLAAGGVGGVWALWGKAATTEARESAEAPAAEIPAELPRAKEVELALPQVPPERYPELLAEAEAILESDPGNLEAWAAKGQMHYLLGDFAAAARALDRALELDPGNAAVLLERGWVRLQLSNFSQALDDFTSVLERDPEQVSAHYGRAEALRFLDLHEGAILEYTWVIERYPDHGAAWLGRGVSHSVLDDKLSAVRDLQRAFELDAELETATDCARLALLLVKLERFDDALPHAERAIELDPEHGQAYYIRAECRRAEQDYDLAVADYTRALELQPGSVVVLVGRGAAYLRLERLAEALADFDAVVSGGVNLASAFLGRGQVYLGLRREDEALADLDRALELDPRQFSALTIRGQLRVTRGDYEGGLQDLTVAVEVAPNAAIAWSMRGDALRRLLRYTEALESFGRAHALGERSVRVYGGRGDTYRALKRHAEAVPDLDRAIEIAPVAWLYVSRAGSLMGLRRYREAIADLDRALELNPDPGLQQKARVWRKAAAAELAKGED